LVDVARTAPFPPPPRKRRKVGPYSKHLAFARLDRRTVEGRFAADVVESLYGQMRATPTPGQQIVAQQVALKLLRCEKMLPRILTGEITGDPERQYLAWSNSIRRDLEALGLLADAPPAPTRSLADIAREIAAEAAD
jgi:hypothetical protein